MTRAPTACLAVCLIWPGFRFAMEAFAVSRLIYASVVASFPALGAATVQEPFINATIVVGGGLVLSMIFYSDWFGRRFLFDSAVATVRLRQPLGDAPDLDVPEEALERICYTRGGASVRGALHALVTDAARDAIEHTRFHDVARYLRSGDLLVVNDTKVLPARLFGHRATGGKVEVGEQLLEILAGAYYVDVVPRAQHFGAVWDDHLLPPKDHGDQRVPGRPGW